VVGDIDKAFFLNVGLQVQDRDTTRFLWLKDSGQADLENNLQVYRFCRAPFGVISSSLAKCPLPVAKKLQENIYVDNVITGVDILSEAKDLYTEAKSLFAAA